MIDVYPMSEYSVVNYMDNLSDGAKTTRTFSVTTNCMLCVSILGVYNIQHGSKIIDMQMSLDNPTTKMSYNGNNVDITIETKHPSFVRCDVMIRTKIK